VDVSEVERVGPGEVAQVEHDEDSFWDVLEGGVAAHPRVMLGAQGELDVIALLLRGVVFLFGSGADLGTAIGAPYQHE